jgi:DNA-binding MarR family transcriptional regulator
MVSAYREELGDAFPAADPRSVLLVLQECNRPEPTSQKQIQIATGIPQSNLAKLMARMIEREWLEISERDPKTGVKTVSVTFVGAVLVNRFEKACLSAVKNARKKKTYR